MKNILILFTVWLLTSCSNHTHNTTDIVENRKTIIVQKEIIIKKVSSNNNFNIVEIDGCEYIWFDVSSDGWSRTALVHKGNCRNHI